jgi:phospholipid transport system substrate-binding protein
VKCWSAHATAMAVAWTFLGVPASRPEAAAPVAVAPEPATQEEGPRELMTGLSARLFAALDLDRNRDRRQPGRVVALVDALMSPHFDAGYTARLVLGAHWRTATPEQRERFASALYWTLLSTYAGAIAEWTPDQLRILPLRDDPAALQAVVRTEIARPGVPVAAVDYRLHRTDQGWKVFDVIVDGVSYVRSHHDDIDGEVERTGLDAATARLESRRSDAGVTAH